MSRAALEHHSTRTANENGYNERFRDECRNENWFADLAHAREMVAEWQQDYNQRRPHIQHSALARRSRLENDSYELWKINRQMLCSKPKTRKKSHIPVTKERWHINKKKFTSATETLRRIGSTIFV